MSDEIPQWAKERAIGLMDFEAKAAVPWTFKNVPGAAVDAFARYIAQHEQPPVDPDLVKAREICGQVAEEWLNDEALEEYRLGRYDDDPEVQFALSALKEARNG